MRFAMLLVTLMALASHGQAANTPCSGSKGGISHCEGATFVCNDGTASGSRRDCRSYFGGSSQQTIQPATGSACPCSGNQLCTGPRGGRYCLTSGGNKSYK